MKHIPKKLTKKTDVQPPASHTQTRQQREEDAFMHEHGNQGSRAIYRVVDALSQCGNLPTLLSQLRIFRKTQPGHTYPHKPPVVTQRKTN